MALWHRPAAPSSHEWKHLGHKQTNREFTHLFEKHLSDETSKARVRRRLRTVLWLQETGSEEPEGPCRSERPPQATSDPEWADSHAHRQLPTWVTVFTEYSITLVQESRARTQTLLLRSPSGPFQGKGHTLAHILCRTTVSLQTFGVNLIKDGRHTQARETRKDDRALTGETFQRLAARSSARSCFAHRSCFSCCSC